MTSNGPIGNRLHYLPDNQGHALLVRGNSYLHESNLLEAFRCYRSAFIIFVSLGHKLEAGLSADGLGHVFQLQQSQEGAVRSFNMAINMYKLVYGDEHPIVAATLEKLGRVYEEGENWEGANASFRLAWSIRKKRLDSPEQLFSSCYSLANSYERSKDFVSALLVFEEGLTYLKNCSNICEYKKCDLQIKLIQSILNIQKSHEKNENIPKYLYKLLDLVVSLNGPNSLEAAHIFYSLASHFYQEKKYDLVINFGDQALTIYREKMGPTSEPAKLVAFIYNRAKLEISKRDLVESFAHQHWLQFDLFYYQKDYPKALEHLNVLLKHYKDNFGEDHIRTLEIATRMDEVERLNAASLLIGMSSLKRP